MPLITRTLSFCCPDPVTSSTAVTIDRVPRLLIIAASSLLTLDASRPSCSSSCIRVVRFEYLSGNKHENLVYLPNFIPYIQPYQLRSGHSGERATIFSACRPLTGKNLRCAASKPMSSCRRALITDSIYWYRS